MLLNTFRLLKLNSLNFKRDLSSKADCSHTFPSRRAAEECVRQHHQWKSNRRYNSSDGTNYQYVGTNTNFLVAHPKSQTSPILCLGELEAFCSARSESPMNDDEPFAIDSYFDASKPNFGVFASHNRLLQTLRLTTALQADASYKLSWNGFPVLVIGNSDQDRKFHPEGIAVTSTEAHSDSEFLFRDDTSFLNGYNSTMAGLKGWLLACHAKHQQGSGVIKQPYQS